MASFTMGAIHRKGFFGQDDSTTPSLDIGTLVTDIVKNAPAEISAAGQLVSAIKGKPAASVIQKAASSTPTAAQLVTTKTIFGLPLGVVVVGGLAIAGGLTFLLLKKKR